MNMMSNTCRYLFVASTWRAVNDFKLVAYRCCSSLPHAEQSTSRKRKKVTKDKLKDNKELNSNLEKLKTNGNDMQLQTKKSNRLQPQLTNSKIDVLKLFHGGYSKPNDNLELAVKSNSPGEEFTEKSSEEFTEKSSVEFTKKSSDELSLLSLENKEISRIVDDIKSQNDVESAINFTYSKITEREKSFFTNVILIEGLKRIENLQRDNDLKLHEDFGKILKFVEDIHLSLSKQHLIICIGSLLAIVDNDNYVLELLEIRALYLLRKMSIGQVIKLYNIHVRSQGTKLRKHVQEKCEHVIADRWSEIQYPSGLITMLKLPRTKQNRDIMLKLEDTVFKVVDKLMVYQLCTVLDSLAESKSRNAPVIRSVVYHLCKSSNTMTASRIQRLLQTCYILSIYNTELFERVSKDLLSAHLTNRHVCLSILTSFSQLRWRQEDSISNLVDKLFCNEQKPSQKETIEILLSLSNLDFCLDEMVELLQSHYLDMIDMEMVSPLHWLNFVWSLTVLGKATPKLISSVLEEEFYQSVIEDFDKKTWKYLTYKSKLTSVDCASHYDLHNYDGPHLPDSFLTEHLPVQGARGTKMLQMAAEVLECLNTVVGQDNYKPDVITPCGYRIEAEMIIGSKGQPVVPQEADISTSLYLHRVAIKVLGFHDMTLPDNLPTGPVAMAIRHLSRQGYKVLSIPHHEWTKLDKPKKEKYLKKKIKNIVS